jgi:hypothetical protein
MEQGESGFRYRVQHIGDMFVDLMGNVVGGMKDVVRGVSLTYELHCLRTEKGKIVHRIGERVIEIRKSDPTITVAKDDQALQLFAEFDGIQEKLEASIMERESRLNRWSFTRGWAE